MQTLFWIIAAFILGLIVGWWLSGRCKCEQQEARPVVEEAKPEPELYSEPEPELKPEPEPEPKPQVESVAAAVAAPLSFASSSDAKDDLKRIKGIGAVIEKKLNALEIYTFAQISEFTEESISHVEEHLSFPGRITRENWVAQAKSLAAGERTEFSDRVDKGDVSY